MEYGITDFLGQGQDEWVVVDVFVIKQTGFVDLAAQHARAIRTCLKKT